MTSRWVFLVALTSCSLHHTVSDSAFDALPVDRKVRLLDAENDVRVALDEGEQMRHRLDALRRERSEAQREAQAARRTEDPLARAAHNMWHKRVLYLEGSLDYLARREAAQQTHTRLARAKFELAKALLLRKHKLAGAQDVNVKDFDCQLAEATAAAKAADAALERDKPRLQRLRLDWLKERDDLAASSLSAVMAPGEDEQPVWELW